MHVTIDYPEAGSEKAILELARNEALNGENADTETGSGQAHHKISQQSIFEARREVLKLYMAENLEEYLLHMVLATRNPGAYGDDLAQWSLYGASPRATIAIDRCARAHAWLAGRDYVDPDDIQSIAYDVLRHRIILSYEAEAEGVTPDIFIRELISRIAVP
jgi:MoxR-like ATPase